MWVQSERQKRKQRQSGIEPPHSAMKEKKELEGWVSERR
jgi:hypothetical protein